MSDGCAICNCWASGVVIDGHPGLKGSGEVWKIGNWRPPDPNGYIGLP